MEKKIIIKTEKIQLDQFLKWAEIIQSGGQIRVLLDEKRIYINGILCHVEGSFRRCCGS